MGDLAAVERGPLTLTVTSSGSVRSSEAKVIKNDVEGFTRILWIIEEGKQVEKGQLLMELDSSEWEDEKLEEEIEVEASRASFVSAEQMLQIAEKQGQANIESAQVEYRLALLDLEKFAGISAADYERYASQCEPEEVPDAVLRGTVLGELNALASAGIENDEQLARFRELLEQIEGSYQQELRKALNNIVLADAETERARDQFEGSKELYDLRFIAETELEADRLDLQRKLLAEQVAADDLKLLAKFSFRRTVEELLSAVSEKEFGLERAAHEATANVVDARASMTARQERLVRDEQNLKHILEQLQACKVYAPQAGMVVYGTTGRGRPWDRVEPLAEGVSVHERQDLFRLPTTDRLIADIRIHESALERVSEGMSVRLSSNALPGKTFRGVLEKISVLPNSESQWLNPDLKVYDCQVALVEDGLRTGMSCKAEVIVEELADALYVPIQTVVMVDGQPTVYLPSVDGELAPHPVEVGLDDSRVVHIVSGLEEGQLVSLTPPLEEGELRTELEDEPIDDPAMLPPEVDPEITAETVETASAGGGVGDPPIVTDGSTGGVAGQD